MTVVKSRAGHPTCKTNLAILLTRGSFFFLVYVTVFGKTNQLARISIITYTWRYSFEHEDANGI